MVAPVLSDKIKPVSIALPKMTMILTLGLNALKHVEAKCPWIMICQVKTNENMSYALFFYISKMILDGTKIFWTRPKKKHY